MHVCEGGGEGVCGVCVHGKVRARIHVCMYVSLTDCRLRRLCVSSCVSIEGY